MERTTRRRVLSFLAVGMAGCSTTFDGSTTEDPPTSSESDSGTPTVASELPTCESSAADQLLRLTPQGVTVEVAGRDVAESVASDLRGIVESSDAVRIVDVEDTQAGQAIENQVDVEVAGGVLEEATVHDAVGDVPEVLVVRSGRSVATARRMAREVRSSLRDAFGPDAVDVAVFVPTGSGPSIVAGVSGAPADSLLGAAGSLEFRVATEDGEHSLVGVGAIRSADGETGRRTGVRFSLTDSGRERFIRGIREAGALASPSAHPIRVSLRGEQIFEGPISSSLVQSMRSGEWDGRFFLVVESAERVDELEAAMNAFAFDVRVETSFERCG